MGAQGFARLNIQDMRELRLADTPPVKLSLANHLHPSRRAAFSSVFVCNSHNSPGTVENERLSELDSVSDAGSAAE